MPVDERNLDRGKGSGSRSAIEDEKMGDCWETRDQRSDTRTTYYARDVDSLSISVARKRQLKRMLKRQEGQHVNSDKYDSRGQQNHKEDKRRMVGSFGSQLGLTSAQKKRVEHLIMSVLDINSFGSYSCEQVVLGTINVVAREDGRWIEDEKTFYDLMEATETTATQAKRLREMVRERVPSL